MTNQEIVRLINRYIGVNGGHLGEFTLRSLAEFFPEFCDLDIDTMQHAGTKRERFEAVLRASPPDVQAKIIRGILKKHPPLAEGEFRTRQMHDEFLRVAQRLEGLAGVATPTLETSSKGVELALTSAEALVMATGATSGVDRLHTALHGYLRAVCDSEGIPYTKEATINVLFNQIREQHPAFSKSVPKADDIAKICRGMGKVMDALNPIRNEGSLAHPTEELLEEAEAMLVINIARTMLHYINAKLSG